MPLPLLQIRFADSSLALMPRGGSIGYKRKTRNKVLSETKCSDESDEDYKVDEDEEFDVSEDDCSFAEDEYEDSLGLEEEDGEWLEKNVKKVGRQGTRAKTKTGTVKQKKKIAVYSKEEDDRSYSFGAKRRKKNMESYNKEEGDEIVLLHSQEKDKDCEEKFRKKSQSSKKQISRNFQNENPRAKYNVLYKEIEYSDFDDSCEDDDESKEEDEHCEEKLRKKLQTSRKEMSRNSQIENHRAKDKVLYKEELEDSDFDDCCEDDDVEFTPGEVLINSRKPFKKQVLRRKNRSNICRKARDESLTLPKNNSIKEWGWGRRRRRRKVVMNSDSDFVSSGSSDYEYTVSEEEREQVKEAAEFCRRLATRSRSSRPSEIRKEEKLLPSVGKRLGRKGKQKEVELKIEVGKQVCGICLSEEGKKTVRGVLNCCSHHFCFACIMEWSKVESRCPLCKQRFSTISRTARAEDGHDLRDAIFPVPERDQVYEPSEEELRGYLDPYENVLCTECLQGGDDALMLLCDLCDSPAHTYCVGLGHEVPDGNWYCDGCRPTALSSSNVQTMNAVPDHGPSANLSVGSPPVPSVRETFDLNEAYVPDTPLSQETGHYQSPRHSTGHFQGSSPVAGSGAFTLFDRRRIQRQIHHILNNRRQIDRNSAISPVPSIRLFGSPIGHDGVVTTRNHLIPARTARRNMRLQERFPDYNTLPEYSREVFSRRASQLRDEALCNQASTSTSQSSGGLLLSEFSGINTRIGVGLGHSQLHPCSGLLNAVPNSSTSQYQFREATVPSRTLQLTP